MIGSGPVNRAAGASLNGGRAPAWSEDGNLIAYIRPQFDNTNGSGGGLNRLIVMRAVDGSSKRTIASVPSGASGLNEAIWASMRRIVFDISPDGLLRSADVRSRRTVSLAAAENVATNGDAFSLSPNGRLVAFVSNGYPLTHAKQPTLGVGLVASSGGHLRLL